MKNWYKVDIAIDNEAVEPLSGGLFELSPSGVQIETPEQPGDISVLTIYPPGDSSIEDLRLSIAELLDKIGKHGFNTANASVSIATITDENWAENYKQFFSPLRIGRVLIIPSWEKTDILPDDLVIQLDPGLAFGTGWHPTTEGCLRLLQQVVEGGETVLDIGTGSGVLAIAAAKLGAIRVLAIDNDPVAIEVAQENAIVNGTDTVIEFQISDIEKLGRVSADIVVANITAPVILAILPLVAENVIDLKTIIASGITDEQKDGVIAALEKHGFSVEKLLEKNQWVTLVSHRG